MLTPAGSPVPLPPQPSQPVIPTAPNSPSMGRFQSMGAISDMSGGTLKVQELPPGFIPSAPATPTPTNTALDPTLGRPYSRTGPPMSIYGPPQPPAAVPEVQRSVSSSSSGPNPYAKGMHSRSRSAGQASVDSLAGSARSKTPLAPPSAASIGVHMYQAAPVPAGFSYPAPPGPPPGGVPSRAGTSSPQSTTSKKSGHTRSRSMYAGSTPAPPSRPLSTAPPLKLRRIPSDASNDSAISGSSKLSKSYAHYEPNQWLDPAFLASGDDLPLSPNTHANTRANATISRLSGGGRNSPALSYVSLRERTDY